MLSVSSQRKYNFYHQKTLLDAFRTNSRNIIGRNPSKVIPLLANQDMTPMLCITLAKAILVRSVAQYKVFEAIFYQNLYLVIGQLGLPLGLVKANFGSFVNKDLDFCSL